ncbi:MAG: thiamine pyrophosphate-binding protein [Nitrosomonadales bacterium]|nr:thiamine pyrophosphate-binding protein [Nitrosomonadales bacterium]
MPIRVSEYIADYLAQAGVRHVFLVTGGGAMFLNDAFGFHPDIEVICNHHEQASAMAAEGYARLSGMPGVVNVTTGPGGINALNGVFGAWTDSIPMLVISGQVKRETCMAGKHLPGLRQLGDQEADIVAMARPVTKYCETVLDPADIAWHLDQAWHLASSGRPGPCWLDIPIDVQAAMIEPDSLRRYQPPQENAWPDTIVERHSRFIMERIAQSKRPVIMAGTGIRAGNALEEFETAVHALGLPVVTAWTHDLIASDDPLYCGRPGTIGTRAGNFTVQNADLLIVLGSRLNIRQTSYNWASFARNAFVIQVDIDPAELDKPTYRPDHAIHCDAKPLLAKLADMLAAGGHEPAHWSGWLAWCRQRMTDYPVVMPQQRETKNGRINPYHFVERLFESLAEDDIVACANAAACIVPAQVARLKRGQRLFTNSGSASMGYDLPAAIGAWYGAVRVRGDQDRVICLAGDGSLQMNIQELQTVAHHRLPIKIFVLNNRGYLSIRSSQGNFFKRLVGESPDNGVSFPDYVKVAAAYGIPSSRMEAKDFAQHAEEVLSAPGPHLCEVMLDETQGFEPRMSSRQLDDGTIVSPSLEDMYPFLDRDELAKNMLDSSE